MGNHSQWPIVERTIPGWPMCIGRAWIPTTPNTPMAVRVVRHNYGVHWLVTITPPVIPQSEEDR